jgi:hypothetical protein
MSDPCENVSALAVLRRAEGANHRRIRVGGLPGRLAGRIDFASETPFHMVESMGGATQQTFSL